MVAHLEGFEPPTNRFVAEYSIQLSYRCTPCEKRSRQVAHLEGFEPPTNRFVAEYSIQLSYRCMRLATFLRRHIIPAKTAFTSFFEKSIAPFKNHRLRARQAKTRADFKAMTGILDAQGHLLEIAHPLNPLFRCFLLMDTSIRLDRVRTCMLFLKKFQTTASRPALHLLKFQITRFHKRLRRFDGD